METRYFLMAELLGMMSEYSKTITNNLRGFNALKH